MAKVETVHPTDSQRASPSSSLAQLPVPADVETAVLSESVLEPADVKRKDDMSVLASITRFTYTCRDASQLVSALQDLDLENNFDCITMFLTFSTPCTL